MYPEPVDIHVGTYIRRRGMLLGGSQEQAIDPALPSQCTEQRRGSGSMRIFTSLAAVLVVFAGAPAAATDSLLDDVLGVLKTVKPSADGGGAAAAVGGLGVGEVARGLIEALKVGSARVVDLVGRRDGYFADSEIHIPLPDYLARAQSVLAATGLGALGEDLELRLNRAAETAAPEARQVFLDAIAAMTLDDAMAIYDGPDDAATRYFERVMSPDLVTRMRPIIDGAMAETGVARAYDSMVGPYQAMPLMPDLKGDISDYALEMTLKGLFHKLAAEEAAIRHNPAARSTELLQRVFGAP